MIIDDQMLFIYSKFHQNYVLIMHQFYLSYIL